MRLTSKGFAALRTDQESLHFSKEMRRLAFSYECGDDGVRTRDLVVANHALSQLSYIPIPVGPPPEWAYLDSNQGPQLYQSCALAN